VLAVVRQTAGSCLAATPERDDFVHHDFTLANLLTTGTGISGVIDINPPALTSDRGVDLATMLFYVYDGTLLQRLRRHRGPHRTRVRVISRFDDSPSATIVSS
jgi:aminoglycoside phosphotransferase (APT) family kinase protein